MSKTLNLNTNYVIWETNLFNHFTTQMLFDLNGLFRLYDLLNNRTFMDDIDFLFLTPSEYIIKCTMFPIKAEYLFSYADTKVYMDLGGTGNQGVEGYAVGIWKNFIDLGAVVIPTYFNNFLDNSGYTKVEVWLPYLGFHQLDTTLVMGKTIKTYYAVDKYTGRATAYLITQDENNEDYVFFTTEGALGIDVPFGSSNANEVARNKISAGIGLVGGIVSTAANPAIGSLGLASTAINAVNSLQQHVQKGTLTSSSTAINTPRNVFFIITRPNVTYPAGYNHMFGRPYGQYRQLGELQGFTMIENINLAGFSGVSVTELEELENLLKQGIIL